MDENALLLAARDLRTRIRQSSSTLLFAAPGVRSAVPALVLFLEAVEENADRVITLETNLRAALRRLEILEGTAGINEFARQLAADDIRARERAAEHQCATG